MQSDFFPGHPQAVRREGDEWLWLGWGSSYGDPQDRPALVCYDCEGLFMIHPDGRMDKIEVEEIQ